MTDHFQATGITVTVSSGAAEGRVVNEIGDEVYAVTTGSPAAIVWLGKIKLCTSAIIWRIHRDGIVRTVAEVEPLNPVIRPVWRLFAWALERLKRTERTDD